MAIINGVAWFTTGTGDTIGLITLTSFDEEKAYMGVASGKDELADIFFVYDHGAKFPVEQAREIIKIKGKNLNIDTYQ